MEDHRLRSYCLVVETRSFSRAAQAKHVTQSAMSRLIKGLEDELGVTLLHRKGKVIMPTAEGRLFYEHSQKILAEYSLMEQSIGLASAASKSVLRLGISRTPAVRLLPQVIYDFSKAHAGIKLELSVCRTASVQRDLRDGKIDIALVEGPIIDQAFAADAIAEDSVVVIAPENHPLTKKKRVTPRDLIAESVILPDRGSETRELIDKFFREAGIDPKHIRSSMTIGSPELIVQMVQAGMGIAFASKWSVFAAVKDGTVKLLKTSGRKLKRHFYLVSSDKGTLSATATAFREFIKKHSFFIPF